MSDDNKDSDEDCSMDEDDEPIESGSSTETDKSSTSSTSTSSSSSSTSSESESDERLNEKLTLRKVKSSQGRWKLLNEKNLFKKEWLQIFDWLEDHPDDPKLAFCNKCCATMKAHKGILDAHSRSKKHLKNIGVIVDEPKKEEKPDVRQMPAMNNTPSMGTPGMGGPGMEHIQMDDQIGFFTESPADAAHQAVTNLIDKLVEKYHQNRLSNLRVQNEAILKLNVERAKFIRSENQRKLNRRLQKESFLKEAQETGLKFLQLQHETKINAMEDERDAKLRAVEQELVFAKQEYEKKVRLLDSQLSSMK